MIASDIFNKDMYLTVMNIIKVIDGYLCFNNVDYTVRKLNSGNIGCQEMMKLIKNDISVEDYIKEGYMCSLNHRISFLSLDPSIPVVIESFPNSSIASSQIEKIFMFMINKDYNTEVDKETFIMEIMLKIVQTLFNEVCLAPDSNSYTKSLVDFDFKYNILDTVDDVTNPKFCNKSPLGKVLYMNFLIAFIQLMDSFYNLGYGDYSRLEPVIINDNGCTDEDQVQFKELLQEIYNFSIETDSTEEDYLKLFTKIIKL